ncbi:MAG: S-layer family protein, partial [Rhodocyclaceae bacterium]
MSTPANNRYGAYLNGANILATGGTITIDAGKNGIFSTTTDNYIGFRTGTSVTSSTSAISLITDALPLQAGDRLQSSGALTVSPYTAATTIGIAGGAGTLSLPASYFGTNFVNGFSGITVGNSTAGTITVGGATTFGNTTTLISGGDITVNGAVNAKTLTLDVGNDINLNANIAKTAGAADTLLLKAKRDVLVADSVAISSTSGALNVVLQSDSDATNGGAIWLKPSSSITSNGGNVTLSGGSNITTGYAQGRDNLPSNLAAGIYLDTPSVAINSNGGNITMRGRGAVSNTGNYWSAGIILWGSLNSGSGKVNLLGKAAGDAANTRDWGINLQAANTITSANTATDAITLVGDASGSAGLQQLGITVNGGYTVDATAGGGISVTGIKGPTAGTGLTGGWNIGSGSTSGLITVIADVITTMPTLSTTGALTIKPYTAGTTIGIAGGAGTLALTAGTLSGSFSGITVGDSTAGAITVGGAVTLNSNTALVSGGNIALNGAITATGRNLTLNTTGSVTQSAAVTAAGLELLGTGGNHQLTNAANSITAVAGNTGTVNLTNNAANWSIGTVNTVGLTATANTTLSTTGAATQSAAITASGLSLLGTGGSYVLNNSGNNAATLAANTGSVSYTDTDALTIGTVGATNGIAATGAVSVATNSGDLTVAQNVASTDTSAAAVLLNAGKTTAAGTATGGNLVLSGSPTIATGAGGRATLMTGSVSGSTGLTALVVSGSGKFRYNSDEASTGYTGVLGAGTYAIYREQPALTVTPSAATGVYGNAVSLAGVTGTAAGFVNGDTAAVTGGTASFTTAATSSSNVGSYNIAYASGLTNSAGYAITDATGSTGEYSVTARPLTVTADAKTKA